MGFLSSLVFGKPKKKVDPERMRNIARGQSVVGNLLGSSPRMQEWNRQNKEINKNYIEQERRLRKQWKREDENFERNLQVEQGRYIRKYQSKPGYADKYFAEFERKERRELQRSRDKQLEDLKWNKNDDVRGISKNIDQYK